MNATPLFSYCFKNYLTILILIISPLLKWDVEAAVKSSFHAEFTRTCRAILELLDKTLLKDFIVTGEEHLTIICCGPGGKDEITLPVNLTAAEKLISLKVLDPEADTVIIMHGFTDNPKKPVPAAVADAYYALGRHNVLQLDSSIVTSHGFFRSVHASQQIGDIIAKFLVPLYSAKVIHPSKLHILGLSLGGQTASGTAKMFEKITGQKISRITGIDPLGGCYEYRNDSLSKNDAEYVDIIHTNQGIEGLMGSIGHSDYFINGGGPNQPGCQEPTCAHKRSAFLYAESVLQNSTPFYARKCDNLFNYRAGKCDNNEISIMGLNSNSTTRGLYYLRTKDESPFSLGMEGTKSTSNKIFYTVLSEIVKIVPNDLSNFLG